MLDALQPNRWTSLWPELRAWSVSSLDVFCAFCCFMALRDLLQSGLSPLGAYDEAILFTNADLMNTGHALYRDFYAIYPPGTFQIVRAAIGLGLPPIWSMRLLGLVVRLASAFGAAWLVRRAHGPRSFWPTASAVLVLQVKVGVVPYAYTLAVLLGLITIACWPEPGARQRRWVACGLLLAGMSYLRHDLFVYSLVTLSAFELASWLLRRRSLFFGVRQEFYAVAGSVCGGCLLLWAPVFAQAGFSRPLHDLVLDQMRLAMPARVLPLPSLLEDKTIAALAITLPALLADRFPLSLTLSLLGVLTSAALALYRIAAGRTITRPALLLAATSALAAATLPQALGRTDYWHVAFGLPLSLCALFLACGRHAAQITALVAVLPWFMDTRHFISWEDAKRLWQDRDDSVFMTGQRVQLTDFILTHTQPGEPIFVGCTSHRHVLFGPLDLYYWAQRPGATRYMHFDPGVVTDAKVQTEMIADLERTRPRLVLRHDACSWDEPNASKEEGSSLLDDFLTSRYRQTESIGSFQIWRPRENS